MHTDGPNEKPMDRTQPAQRVPRIAMLKSVLPQRLVQLRGQRGMSQRGLAKASGLACSTISAMESGQNKNVLVGTLLSLCGVFMVTPDYLLGINANHTLARAFAESLAKTANGDGCLLCGRGLKVGEPHTQGECIMHGAEAGQSAEYLAGVFGFGTNSIHAILADEYGRRSRQIASEAPRTAA